MAMRFRGGGVGHKSTREATAYLAEDCDPLDDLNRMDDDFEENDVPDSFVGGEGEDSDTEPEDRVSVNSDNDSEDGTEEIWNEYDAEGYAEF